MKIAPGDRERDKNSYRKTVGYGTVQNRLVDKSGPPTAQEFNLFLHLLADHWPFSKVLFKNIYYLERILTSGKANTHSLSLSFEYLEKKSFNFNFEGALVKIQQKTTLFLVPQR